MVLLWTARDRWSAPQFLMFKQALELEEGGSGTHRSTSKPIYSCGLMKMGSSPGASCRLGERKIEARLQWGCNWNERQTNANEDKEFFVSAPSDLSGAQGRNRTTDTVIFSHVLYQLSYLGAGRASKRPGGSAAL